MGKGKKNLVKNLLEKGLKTLTPLRSLSLWLWIFRLGLILLAIVIGSLAFLKLAGRGPFGQKPAEISLPKSETMVGEDPIVGAWESFLMYLSNFPGPVRPDGIRQPDGTPLSGFKEFKDFPDLVELFTLIEKGKLKEAGEKAKWLDEKYFNAAKEKRPNVVWFKTAGMWFWEIMPLYARNEAVAEVQPTEKPETGAVSPQSPTQKPASVATPTLAPVLPQASPTQPQVPSKVPTGLPPATQVPPTTGVPTKTPPTQIPTRYVPLSKPTPTVPAGDVATFFVINAPASKRSGLSWNEATNLVCDWWTNILKTTPDRLQIYEWLARARAGYQCEKGSLDWIYGELQRWSAIPTPTPKPTLTPFPSELVYSEDYLAKIMMTNYPETSCKILSIQTLRDGTRIAEVWIQASNQIISVKLVSQANEGMWGEPVWEGDQRKMRWR